MTRLHSIGWQTCVGLAVALAGCRSDARRELPEVTETLNTRVIFAPRCGKVFFSSNRNGRVAPFALEAPFTAPAVRLAYISNRDLLARSVSADCGQLALVADQGGDGIYDVFLYDLAANELRNLTRTKRDNEGEPKFSPDGRHLAFLRNNRLVLYDVPASAERRATSTPTEFVSLEWSPDGRRLFLEDRATSIWTFTPGDSTFTRLWTAPRKAYSPRSLHVQGRFLYFASDHESEFSQIYELDLATSALRRVAPSEHDQYSPRHDGAGGLTFRTTAEGNVLGLWQHGDVVDTVGPKAGVVYDFSFDFGIPLFVYAGARQPASIYATDSVGAMRDLLNRQVDVRQPAPRAVYGRDGMVHYVFADSLTTSWVVWLHGGPDEQVSPRYNLYFDYLARLGYGVVALNYPGSTGIGNGYELRGLPDSVQVARQTAGIEEGIADVAAVYPSLRRYVLIGVSYGSAIAFRHLQRHPADVIRFVDFSGVTKESSAAEGGGAPHPLPPTLLIYGENDPAQRSAARRELLRYRQKWMETRRLVLDNEGHFVSGRKSIQRALGEIERFLIGSGRPFDVVILGGRIADGTGRPQYAGDIAIAGGRIVRIVPSGGLARARARRRIEAHGLTVAPGFIDIMGQSQIAALYGDGRLISKLTQGVTTEILGEGISAAPLKGPTGESIRAAFQGRGGFGRWLAAMEARGISANVGSFVGGSTLRRYAMGGAQRAPTWAELDTMRVVIADAMRDGAFGLGTALAYPPGSYASKDELVALAREVARHGGVYATHLRSEGDALLEAIDEALEIGRAGGVAVEIYHLKAAGVRNWPKLRLAVAKIDSARAHGADVGANMYPYAAARTTLSVCLPPWASADGRLLANLADPLMRQRIHAEMLDERAEWESSCRLATPDDVIVTGFRDPELRRHDGRRLKAAAEMEGTDWASALIDWTLRERRSPLGIFFLADEEALDELMRAPWIKFGSDAGGMAPDARTAVPHPRAFGTYPRILGRFVRERRTLTLEDAIRRMTGAVAQRLRIPNRGVLREDAWADVVIFDENTIADRASYDDPRRISVGVRHVLVNGVEVVKNGRHTGEKPGRAVRGPGYERH
ncbi:MAG TPA: amidohydrolase family protein [Gemmatimonadales bacterium]|nr:amidohydrolase family protein [Gemmatimonadales bacterium]